jgi:hypothetical protein
LVDRSRPASEQLGDGCHGADHCLTGGAGAGLARGSGAGPGGRPAHCRSARGQAAGCCARIPRLAGAREPSGGE